MQRIVGGILVLTLGLSVRAAGDDALDQSDAPAKQYEALLKEYQATTRDFRQANSDEERNAAVERWGKFSPRFLELAEKNPKNPIALTILKQVVQGVNSVDSAAQNAWEMNTTTYPDLSKDDTGARAVAVLVRDHLRSDKLGPICERMRYGGRKEFGTFLRMVLTMNPDKDVQGIACLALAQFLNNRLHMLDQVKDRPEFAKRYQDLFGKDYFEELQRQDRGKLGEEVEGFFEQAADSYADVKLPYGETVGETAKSVLFEIRHLAVGKKAPELEGEDQDAKRFKLSDYHGKVVLLDFWSEF